MLYLIITAQQFRTLITDFLCLISDDDYKNDGQNVAAYTEFICRASYSYAFCMLMNNTLTVHCQNIIFRNCGLQELQEH